MPFDAAPVRIGGAPIRVSNAVAGVPSAGARRSSQSLSPSPTVGSS
jgi:hypothetical protein